MTIIEYIYGRGLRELFFKLIPQTLLCMIATSGVLALTIALDDSSLHVVAIMLLLLVASYSAQRAMVLWETLRALWVLRPEMRDVRRRRALGQIEVT